MTTAIVRNSETPALTNTELVRATRTESWMPRIEEHPGWETLSQIEMTMRAEVLLHRFRVSDLTGLAEGQVFETLTPGTEDVPIKVGNVELGWGEFEVVEQQIALRITRLG